MNTSFLYHALGVREQECSRIRYEDNSIILDIQTRMDKLRCPCCQSRNITLSGRHDRLIRSVPIGSKSVFLKMKIYGVKCKKCSCVRQEHVHFLTGKRTYTNRFSRLVVELSRRGTRWLLLCNGRDIFDQKFKSRLDNALNLNEPIMKAYYLEESLKEIWMQVNKKKQRR